MQIRTLTSSTIMAIITLIGLTSGRFASVGIQRNQHDFVPSILCPDSFYFVICVKTLGLCPRGPSIRFHSKDCSSCTNGRFATPQSKGKQRFTQCLDCSNAKGGRKILGLSIWLVPSHGNCGGNVGSQIGIT